MISIVTGTLNRLNFLENLINNTVNANTNLELVLIDGGSTDGTIEYIKNLKHPRIKFVEIGHRSSYPHFMNIGIKNSKYDWICQWNDDVLLANNWNEIINEISNEFDFYLFNWKYGNHQDITNDSWLSGEDNINGWCLLDDSINNGEIVMNYGIYNKNIFRKIGMYNNEYRYYYADGDMSYRAHKFGFKHKTLKNIKVCSLITPKAAFHVNGDDVLYSKNLSFYNQNILPDNLEYL